MKKIKLVAFDWNGTLISDTNLVVKAESHVLINYGLRATNLKEFQETYAVPFKLYWVRMGLEPDLFDRESGKIRKLFFDYYEPLEKLVRTRAGAREVLTWLAENEIQGIILSNHMESNIRAQLTRLKIDTLTDILGFTSVEDTSLMHKRGKELKLLDYANKRQLKPDEIIIIGDTVEEIEIGHKYGYVTVALTGGSQSTRLLKASKPHYLIHNLAHLKSIIQNHGRITSRN